MGCCQTRNYTLERPTETTSDVHPKPQNVVIYSKPTVYGNLLNTETRTVLNLLGIADKTY